MTPAEKRAAEQRIIGQRLRRRRLEAGLTAKAAAQGAGVSSAVWANWELGSRPYPIRRLAAIASALQVPIASLVVDQLVLAEIRVSDETLERVKRDGRPAALVVGERLAAGVAELLLAEASRPPADLSPGARAKPRRSREQVLADREAGFERNRKRLAANAEERRRARQVAAA